MPRPEPKAFQVFFVLPAVGSETHLFLVPQDIWKRDLSPLYGQLDAGSVARVQVQSPNGPIISMWVDEEGLMKVGRPVNTIATALYATGRTNAQAFVGTVAFDLGTIASVGPLEREVLCQRLFYRFFGRGTRPALPKIVVFGSPSKKVVG